MLQKGHHIPEGLLKALNRRAGSTAAPWGVRATAYDPQHREMVVSGK
jgi:hypothetical protein